MTLNQRQIQRIIMLHGLGYNQQEVANKIGYSRSTVTYYLHKFKKEMDEYYTKYDELYTSVANEIFDVWKEESLLINNKGD